MLKEKKKVKLPDEIENLFRCICYFILYQVIFRSSQFNGLCPRWKDQWGRVSEGHGPLQVRSVKPCQPRQIKPLFWLLTRHHSGRVGIVLTLVARRGNQWGHGIFAFLWQPRDQFPIPFLDLTFRDLGLGLWTGTWVQAFQYTSYFVGPLLYA